MGLLILRITWFEPYKSLFILSFAREHIIITIKVLKLMPWVTFPYCHQLSCLQLDVKCPYPFDYFVSSFKEFFHCPIKGAKRAVAYYVIDTEHIKVICFMNQLFKPVVPNLS